MVGRICLGPDAISVEVNGKNYMGVGPNPEIVQRAHANLFVLLLLLLLLFCYQDAEIKWPASFPVHRF